MARLCLSDDVGDLAGHVMFEPSLNPWLGAALAQAPGAEGEGEVEREGRGWRGGGRGKGDGEGRGITAAAALRSLTEDDQTQPIPGQTLGYRTARAALCGQLGAALLGRARAWEREAWF